MPEGTVVKDGDGEVLADLVGPGREFVVARGGRGGLGNKALASARRKAPGFALLGEPGDAARHRARAQVARRRRADRLPVARASPRWSRCCRPPGRRSPTTRSPRWCPTSAWCRPATSRFTIADVPGLIPGASEGKGLGLEFLRHVERCSVLVHVIDCATLEPGRDPMTDLDVIEARARRSTSRTSSLGGRPLAERTRIVVLNKADVPEALELAEMVKPDLEARGIEVFIVSAVAHTGLQRAHLRAWPATSAARAEIESRSLRAAQRVVIRPKSPSTTPASRSSARTPPTARSSASSASGPPAGSARPTSPTTRPSATSPTGSSRARRRGGAVQGRCRRRARPCSSARRTTRSSSTGSRP